MVSFNLAEESPIKVDDRLRGDEGSALRAMSGTLSPTYVRVSDAHFKPHRWRDSLPRDQGVHPAQAALAESIHRLAPVVCMSASEPLPARLLPDAQRSAAVFRIPRPPPLPSHSSDDLTALRPVAGAPCRRCQRPTAAVGQRQLIERGPNPSQVGGQNGVQMPKPKAKPRVENNRVLVTGGAGFVGSHLCTYLVNRGDHVRLSTHRRTRACRTPWRTVSGPRGCMLLDAAWLCPAVLEQVEQLRRTAGLRSAVGRETIAPGPVPWLRYWEATWIGHGSFRSHNSVRGSTQGTSGTGPRRQA